jgi:hypothetical protein
MKMLRLVLVAPVLTVIVFSMVACDNTVTETPSAEKSKPPSPKSESSPENIQLKMELLGAGSAMFEVLDALGNPSSVKVVEDGEIWHYAYDDRGNPLGCVFDGDKRVKEMLRGGASSVSSGDAVIEYFPKSRKSPDRDEKMGEEAFENYKRWKSSQPNPLKLEAELGSTNSPAFLRLSRDLEAGVVLTYPDGVKIIFPEKRDYFIVVSSEDCFAFSTLPPKKPRRP